MQSKPPATSGSAAPEVDKNDENDTDTGKDLPRNILPKLKEPNGASETNAGQQWSSTWTETETETEPSKSDQTIQWLSGLKDSLFLGISPTPAILTIMTIYFVEGALGLARLAETYLLKDELHLGPAEASALGGLLLLPWTIKPLYGFLTDAFPVFGSRRRSYLIICGLLGCLADLSVGSNFFSLTDSLEATKLVGSISINPSQLMLATTIGSLLLSSATIAFSDVVIDGVVVQQTRESDDPKVAGGLQSLCWGSAAFGGLISSYFSGSLLEVVSPRTVFTICAALPLLIVVSAFAIEEEQERDGPEPVTIVPTQTGSLQLASNANDDNDDSGDGSDDGIVVSDTNGVQRELAALWSALKEPSIWKPTLFLFLWQSTPSSGSAFLYFMTNDLGIGPEFLGRARLVTNLSSLAGVWLYQKYFRTVSG